MAWYLLLAEAISIHFKPTLFLEVRFIIVTKITNVKICYCVTFVHFLLEEACILHFYTRLLESLPQVNNCVTVRRRVLFETLITVQMDRKYSSFMIAGQWSLL